jgi:hypothetical protein
MATNITAGMPCTMLPDYFAIIQQFTTTYLHELNKGARNTMD